MKSFSIYINSSRERVRVWDRSWKNTLLDRNPLRGLPSSQCFVSRDKRFGENIDEYYVLHIFFSFHYFPRKEDGLLKMIRSYVSVAFVYYFVLRSVWEDFDHWIRGPGQKRPPNVFPPRPAHVISRGLLDSFLDYYCGRVSRLRVGYKLWTQ